MFATALADMARSRGRNFGNGKACFTYIFHSLGSVQNEKCLNKALYQAQVVLELIHNLIHVLATKEFVLGSSDSL